MAPIRRTLCAGVMLMALPLGLAGCGKAPPPPDGAPKEKQVDPDIQLGNPSGAPADSKEAPKDEKGDK